MRPTKTRDANKIFKAPTNWDPAIDGPCGDLEVRMERYGERLVDFISTWKPSAEDIAHIVRGGVIELSAIGGQPPVGLRVVDPVSPPQPDQVALDDKHITINEEAHGL